MSAAKTIREARLKSGMSLRALAQAAGTSHSTLSAYEHGAKTPNVATLDRIVNAAGFALDRQLCMRVADGGRRGEELAAVLELAAEFPARHTTTLDCPVFGR